MSQQPISTTKYGSGTASSANGASRASPFQKTSSSRWVTSQPQPNTRTHTAAVDRFTKKSAYRYRPYAFATATPRYGSRRSVRTTQVRRANAAASRRATAPPVRAAATSRSGPNGGSGHSTGRHAATSPNTRSIGMFLVYARMWRAGGVSPLMNPSATRSSEIHQGAYAPRSPKKPLLLHLVAGEDVQPAPVARVERHGALGLVGLPAARPPDVHRERVRVARFQLR